MTIEFENSVSYLEYSLRQKWLKYNTTILTTEIQQCWKKIEEQSDAKIINNTEVYIL